MELHYLPKTVMVQIVFAHFLRQDGTGEAALAVDELAGAQGDQHDAEEVGGARRQAADEGVNRVGHQIHWRGGQGKRCLVRFVHPTSIAAPGRFSLLQLVKLE